MKELGEIDMVSMALATLDLVTHHDARPAFPAVDLEGHTVLSYGELAGAVAFLLPTRCASCSADRR